MNDTPCPICNHLLAQRRQAFIKREYAALAYYEHQHEIHAANCDIMQQAYYLGLWQNARVVQVTAPAAQTRGESEHNNG